MGVFLVDDGETVREVERLALCDERRNGGPSLRLCGVRKKVHDDGSAVDGFLDGEEGFAWYLLKTSEREREVRKGRTDPAVLECLLPTLAVLADTDDDIETVVTGIQALAMTLGAIADEGEGVVFEVVVESGKGPVAALIDDLVRARKVEGLDATRREGLGRRVSQNEVFFD